ncbi:MAG TPA: hypothetical protein VIP77_13845 [Jiangellaceae bacterium]
MTADQLELPLFEPGTPHSAQLTWSPIGKPDGTYTVTCDCDRLPQTSHTWAGWQARFTEHCNANWGTP